jgi:N4-gp56 family major capsid protein
MARTIIGVNDPRAVKKWSGNLALDTSAKSYFNSRFMQRGAEAEVPVQILTELESDAGEEIKYDLLAELTMAPVEGDDTLEGKEEKQRFYTDSVYIDQARCGVNTGGRMTRKRTLHNLREKAKRQQSSWWARFFDELLFIYGSGARGINPNFLVSTSYAGRANNPLVAPDTAHQLYGGDATLFSNIDANDKMTLTAITNALNRATVQGGGISGVPVMQPCKIDGEEVFVCVMHTWQEDDLRKSTATGDWLDLQKAAAGAEGKSSPLFKKNLGMHRNVILHSHKNVIRFNNAGAGAVEAARALFMGSQAMTCAFGSPGTNMRFDWNEESRDNNNQVVITSAAIFGCKKVTFTTDEAGAQDFGVMAIDTACATR